MKNADNKRSHGMKQFLELWTEPEKDDYGNRYLLEDVVRQHRMILESCEKEWMKRNVSTIGK